MNVVLSAVAHSEKRYFKVGVVGYYIEGQAYAADSLAVGLNTTPNIAATKDGFSCDAFFPPDRLEEAIVQATA